MDIDTWFWPMRSKHSSVLCHGRKYDNHPRVCVSKMSDDTTGIKSSHCYISPGGPWLDDALGGPPGGRCGGGGLAGGAPGLCGGCLRGICDRYKNICLFTINERNQITHASVKAVSSCFACAGMADYQVSGQKLIVSTTSKSVCILWNDIDSIGHGNRQY